MVRKSKLLPRARNNPRDVRCSDLLTLVEATGFVLVRQRGTGHRRYLHPETETYLDVRPDKNGKAKRYQVEQFIQAVDALGLRVGDDES